MMKKLFLFIGLVVFLTPLTVFGENKDKVWEQVKKNNKALGLYYYDMKHNPPKACLNNEEVIKIAKKCKVPFKDESQLFSMTIHKLFNELSSELNCSGSYSITAPEGYSMGYKCDRLNTRMSCFEKKQKNAKKKKNCKKRSPEDYGYVKIPTKFLKNKFDDLAMSLGCGIKRKDVEDCVRRYLPSIIGSDPMTIEQINIIKTDYKVMSEVIFAIKELNRAQNQSGEREQTEEEKKQAELYQQQQPNNWVNLSCQPHCYTPWGPTNWQLRERARLKLENNAGYGLTKAEAQAYFNLPKLFPYFR